MKPLTRKYEDRKYDNYWKQFSSMILLIGSYTWHCCLISEMLASGYCPVVLIYFSIAQENLGIALLNLVQIFVWWIHFWARKLSRLGLICFHQAKADVSFWLKAPFITPTPQGFQLLFFFWNAIIRLLEPINLHTHLHGHHSCLFFTSAFKQQK